MLPIFDIAILLQRPCSARAFRMNRTAMNSLICGCIVCACHVVHPSIRICSVQQTITANGFIMHTIYFFVIVIFSRDEILIRYADEKWEKKPNALSVYSRSIFPFFYFRSGAYPAFRYIRTSRFIRHARSMNIE